MAKRASVSIDFIAAPAIVALGSIIGRQLGIAPKRNDNWTVVPNLWGVIVGRPGVMKSYAVTHGLAAISRLEKCEQERFEKAASERRAEREMAEINLDLAKKAARRVLNDKNSNMLDRDVVKNDLRFAIEQLDSIKADAPRRYKINDSTVEQLAVVHSSNPRGLLVVRDELTGFLTTLEKPGREGDREFYLESWEGLDAKTVERISRDDVHLDALCVSICGGMQPAKLDAYVKPAISGGSIQDDGLIQRFQLAVWPDRQGEFIDVDTTPDEAAERRAHRVFEILDKIDPALFGADTTARIPTIRFDDAAQALFTGWRKHLEDRLRGTEMEGTPAFESHMAKFRSLMPSLALIFHLVQWADGAPPAPVSEDSAVLAAAWCDVLEDHARKIYAREVSPAVAAAHDLLERIADVEDGTPVKALYHKGWSGLGTAKQMMTALEVLQRCNVVRLVTADPGPSGGRRSTVVFVNPKVAT